MAGEAAALLLPSKAGWQWTVFIMSSLSTSVSIDTEHVSWGGWYSASCIFIMNNKMIKWQAHRMCEVESTAPIQYSLVQRDVQQCRWAQYGRGFKCGQEGSGSVWTNGSCTASGVLMLLIFSLYKDLTVTDAAYWRIKLMTLLMISHCIAWTRPQIEVLMLWSDGRPEFIELYSHMWLLLASIPAANG